MAPMSDNLLDSSAAALENNVNTRFFQYTVLEYVQSRTVICYAILLDTITLKSKFVE